MDPSYGLTSVPEDSSPEPYPTEPPSPRQLWERLEIFDSPEKIDIQ